MKGLWRLLRVLLKEKTKDFDFAIQINKLKRPRLSSNLHMTRNMFNLKDKSQGNNGENDSYWPKCNINWNTFQILNQNFLNGSENSFELYEFEFTKVAWKSMKSVMIASKSKSKEKNSFMILESQTNDVNYMFSELLAKVENNYHIETKKRMDTTFSSKLLRLSNKLLNKFNIIKSFYHIENNSVSKTVSQFDLK